MKQMKQTSNVIYMTCQETHMNGQQRPLAFPTFRAWLEEAITATATVTRVSAISIARVSQGTSMLFAHFYICRTELCENETEIGRGVVLIESN